MKKQKINLKDFSKITISLSSPDNILDSSFGEVTKPETINYRTYKPEMGGLFCERIFGPVKDYECACGKYKRIRYKSIICDRCGVEVTDKKVRRDRTGHIKLVVPVVHIWYSRSLPNKIGYLLGLPTKKLDMIIYYERYVVIKPGKAIDNEGNPVEYLQFLTEEEYFDIQDRLPSENKFLEDNNPDKFIAKIGAEALHDLLSNLDLNSLSYELRDKAANETSQQRKAEALKRLQVIEAFRDANTRIENRPEWMIVKVIPVIPPELRPLVPLDGGRFATSDLNDLYRRVIIRNNRLKRLIEIKAPDVILRNEKRMLQESVDALFDNSKKSSAVKTESNRPLKSLSDSLKGKQGRFRQNLLGKRVDYSARSVIIVGPELKLHECGMPKLMAAELYKPFIVRKLIERGLVKTVKSAKKIIDNRESVVWDVLENVMKGHPVLLNRAPTLHRLGVQAFQPVLIEGKAIRLHPLVCTAFNADFDGDQMAVHLPLGEHAVLEAQILMLSSHNILNPSNGTPITVPSQDMVLGLYYMTKARKSDDNINVKGENNIFYSSEEVIIAHNEGKADLHANIKVKLDKDIIETTVGRVLLNEVVPDEMGFINEILTKKSLRDIIGNIYTLCGIKRTADFLDKIKELGYNMAFKGGLSFNLSDVKIPDLKDKMINSAYSEVDTITSNYNMGFITNNERYNQVIDVWTNTNAKLTNAVLNDLKSDNQGFNSVYMMLDSGARGSKEQIKQLSGMRGLMAKPQKSGDKSGSAIIENPIISNFKEGLSILEYFISTHGARKGLADTALKTADAGYLTRRLVDVAQDVVVYEENCHTLRGIEMSALKNNQEIVESLQDRIIGRVLLNDVYDFENNLLAEANSLVTDEIATKITNSGVEKVDIRSTLTCDAKKGVCASCYGLNLSKGKMVEIGEAVGVIAAQSIGEPGTQLTLRTFHIGGIATAGKSEYQITAINDGKIEIDDLKTVKLKGKEIVVSRTSEMRLIDLVTKDIIFSNNIPYGSELFVKNGSKIKKDELICEWDPYNALIITEKTGKVQFVDIVENITYRVEIDELTGTKEKVMIERKDKKLNPTINILSPKNKILMSYSVPVGAYLSVNTNKKIEAGQVIAKIPRGSTSVGDITGGLPRVQELFEARNPSNPAVVSEIDGIVSFGPKIKRGNKEVIITSKTDEVKKYLIPLSKHILVQENDYAKSGMRLTDGVISAHDILNIQGPSRVQEFLVNEIQEVYRLQGLKINDKHFECLVRQMMQKVEVLDAGDTRFLQNQIVNKQDFNIENDAMYGMKVVEDACDSTVYQTGQIISSRNFREENFNLSQLGKKVMLSRDAITAIANPILQGITRASLKTTSWISAASFQETTKVLNESAVNGKTDELRGLKENVVVGQQIPAGTGFFRKNNILVGSNAEYNQMKGIESDDEKTESDIEN